MNASDDLEISRRDVLKVGAASIAASTMPLSTRADPSTAAAPPVVAKVSFEVNGTKHALKVDTRTTLLDVLREQLKLTGTKKGCDQGQCGACTVLVNDRRINSCLTLAVMQEGKRVTTVEGLGTPEKLHPMQAAFVKHDGFQCGYCTPGQICSAVAVLNELNAGIPSHVSKDLSTKPLLSALELRERMSGNICRCAAYPNIIDAITEVGQSSSGVSA